MFKYFRQEGIQDCGICSLFNIVRYYGGNIDIEKLRDITNTNENGTSIYNLVNASNKIGFESKAYRCRFNDLESCRLPLIGYMKIQGYSHFVIITDINNDKVSIFDPIRGRITYSVDDFLKEWDNIIITYDRKGDIVKEPNAYVNYLVSTFKKYKNTIIVLMVLSLICSILTIIITFFIKNIFDNNLNNTSLFIFLFLVLIKGVIDFYRNRISIDMNSKLEYEISNNVYKKILSLPLSYHHNRPVGDIIYRITDLYNIKDFINTLSISSIIDFLSLIISILIIMFISIKLFFILLIILLLFVFTYLYYRRNNIVYLNELKEVSSVNNSDISEMLYGIDTIKNLNIEEKTLNKHNTIFIKYLTSFKKISNYLNTESIIFHFIESSGILICLFIGLGLLKKEYISVGELTLFYSLFISLFNSFKNLLSLDRSIVETKISFSRINNLLNTKSNNYLGKTSIKKIDEIRFENKLNLIVKRGEYVLINGKSGIGKSTVFKSLFEKQNIDTNIFINNIDIKEIGTNSVKKNICYVGQNEYLFTGTLKSNILMYKTVNNKELTKVIKTTLLDKTIKSKNITLDYLLEENGHNLSGGERKKILLARALIRKTDFIIFDETFDELDIESERKILSNLKSNYNKTVIVISHRESNIDLYDKRVVMKGEL